MAQQIDFISLSQQAFDNLVSANTVQSSRLYFTSDTHRIYKGADLYAATTFDQLNFTNISASGITVNGVDVALEGHTHATTDIDGLTNVLAGITATAINKTNGSFTGTLSAATISGTGATFTGTVSASTLSGTAVNGTNGNFTGTVSASSIVASSLTVGGSSVALSGHTHSINDVTNLSTTLSGITQTDITKTGTVTAATGSFTNLNVTGTASFTATTISANALTVGGSNVALSGHTHSKADITDFTHTHSINDVTNLSASLTGITQANISKSGYVSAPTISGTTVKGGTGSFTTVSAGTVSATTGSFSTLKVGGVSVALVGHRHTAADLSGITFDEMTVDQFVASSITVDGKGVLLEGSVVGGVGQSIAHGCGVQVAISEETAVPSVTMWGFGPIITKGFVEIANSMTMDYYTYIPTVSAVVGYVEAMIGAVLSSQY